MRHALKISLRRIGVTLAGLLLLVIVLAVFVLGTEPGTRWALRQAIRVVPGELVVDEFSGTFLGGLRVSELGYSIDDVRLTASELRIRLDWFRSSLDRVHLAVFSADELRYRNLAPVDAAPKPLQIAMPPLPIRIGISDLDVRALHIGDTIITALLASDARLRGSRINAETASAEIAGIAINTSRLDTRLEGAVPISVDVSWRQDAGPWSGMGNLSGSLATLDFTHEVSGPWPATAKGKVILLNRIDPEFDAVVRFEQWHFSSLGIRDGEVNISGTTKAYRATFDAGIDVEVGNDKTLSAQVAGEASGDLRELDSLSVTASGPAGRLDVNGKLGWNPVFSTDIEVRAQEFDPSQFSGLAAGSLDSVFRLQLKSIEEFLVQIESLEGNYNKERARARGTLSRSADNWRCADCNLSLGANRLLVDGELISGRLAARLDIDAPDLSLLWSELAGALAADAQIRGNLALPAVSGHISGRNIEWAGWAVASVDLASRSSTLEYVDLDVGIEGLGRNGTVLGGGSARLTGQIDAVEAAMRWDFRQVSLSLDARLAVEDGTLAADLRSANLSEPFAGTWRLSEPMQFSISPGAMRATTHAWENGDARLNLWSFSIADGELLTEATLVAMPLATLNSALPENIRLAGFADAELRFGRSADGSRSGSVRWSQRETIAHITPPREQAIAVAIPVATAEVRLAGAGAEGRAILEIEPGVKGSLDLALEGFGSDSGLSARLRFGGTEWGWISALFPEIDNFKGNINADVSAGGKLSAPELRGELRWQEGSIAVPALNIPITGIDLTVAGSSAGSATIAGSAIAGTGKLVVDGRFDDLTLSSRSFTVSLSGQQATVLNWPDYRLVASPDLVVTGGEAGIKASGRISVDSAEVSVSKLPEGAVSPSEDVTVVGRDEIERNVIPVSGNVELLLSENVHISAFGLDTKVEGKLRFDLQDNREPRAEGKLELVDGVFSAYGQRLTIEEGTMTFTGPLDDPVIYVRAIREIEDLSGTIKAGIELRGRAQNLTSSVFATPSMSEADALAYLILGRPLEDATAADGSMLSGTAFALGLRQATAITNQIGQTLGLDQLAIAGSNQSTTSLVAGKQISSRLYVRYAYGVFSQIGNLLLRYKLSKRLTIEAGTGESQSMDLLYLVEKP
ncbi:MAG: translocation/assembly module TamB domain-containing protein [Gammaproteobacteria bacterium]|nr:translocation/assembly module TamB domain-containing protein [Gammaproteobacteria bacterium]MDH4315224.1 translocation/assembly module TamB domain-containing protein [Gammaproteobacteria bacterium]MDH5215004.1 translocation/assembly module TamB domain-containing protein [Gammaproteobacteria bacterium]